VHPDGVDRYRLVRRVASGGMGEIFLAVRGDDPERGAVVVKRLFRELAQHEEVVRAFHREAELMAHLDHPGVPRLLDTGRQGDLWFMVMEHVDGTELSSLIDAARCPCPWEAAAAIGHQLVGILQHVHGCREPGGRPLGLVHCDVNPTNVLVQPDGSLNLLDFGVARTAADPPPGPVPRGTLRYMAPEQITGGPVDARTDLHAWGVILYELTTGERLRTGPDPQVMIDVVERDARPPSACRRGYPRELEDLVVACLARDPARRPESAGQVGATLEGMARHHGWTLDAAVVAAWAYAQGADGDGRP
jgi:eukaryotic-like serine/threonine-protein kinase